MGTNVQESGVDMTTVETEAGNGNESQVWVRPQRNRGTIIFLMFPLLAMMWYFAMFPFPLSCLYWIRN